MYLRHPWCAPPLAQTFPQLAQHVVERGALTHSHDSERSSLCSQRGSLSALSSLRSARSHDFALLASRTRAPLMGGQRPVQRSRNRLGSPRIDLRARTRAACRGIAKWLERATKDTKNTKNRGPLPPPPPTRSMSKISTVCESKGKPPCEPVCIPAPPWLLPESFSAHCPNSVISFPKEFFGTLIVQTGFP